MPIAEQVFLNPYHDIKAFHCMVNYSLKTVLQNVDETLM